MKNWVRGLVALLAICLIFVGAPRCIPTANLWNQILASVDHGSHVEADAEYCPFHEGMQAGSPSTSTPQKKSEPRKRPNFSQDFMTDGSGCHCQVNAFVNATPVHYQQPKVVHVFMPLAQDIVAPLVKILLTQVTYAPEGPPPKFFA